MQPVALFGIVTDSPSPHIESQQIHMQRTWADVVREGRGDMPRADARKVRRCISAHFHIEQTAVAAKLPFHLWTAILRIPLQQMLDARTTDGLQSLLTTCRFLTRAVRSMRTYTNLCIIHQHLATIEMQDAKHRLFVVGTRGYDVSGLHVACMRHDTPNVVSDEHLLDEPIHLLKEELVESIRKMASGKLSKEPVVVAARQVVLQKRQPSRDAGRALESVAQRLVALVPTLDAVEDALKELQRVRALLDQPVLRGAHRRDATIGISNFSHCSCAGTESVVDGRGTSWAARSWRWIGSARQLYRICRHRRDLAMPKRPVDPTDYDYQTLIFVYDAFIRWYETGIVDKSRIYTPPTEEFDLTQLRQSIIQRVPPN